MYTANIDENPIDMMGLFDDMPVVKYWDGGMNE